jgi:hypothetical protein
MSRATTFLGWSAGGVGVILVYAAISNQSPIDVVRKALTGDDSATARALDKPNVDSAGSAESSAGSDTGNAKFQGSGNIRTDAIAAGGSRDSGDWIGIASQPKFKLAPAAAASFNRVESDYGFKIPLSGAGRSYAEQVIGFNADPGRFASPGNSLHEYGLAVDINSSISSKWNDPALIAAFTKNGWYRRGKRGDWNKDGTVEPEPWHWSYGVPG